MEDQNPKRFILWDAEKGEPRRDHDGSYLTSGAIGHVHEDNVYLTSYAIYPDARRPKDLAVHERICGVRWAMSFTHGMYDIIRTD